MDFYGIGLAMQTMVETLIVNGRATGRTTRMLNSLHDGDRVITHDHNMQRWLIREISKRNLKVDVLVIDPKRIDLKGVGSSHGKTICDHRFVELFLSNEIGKCINELDALESRLSGFGRDSANYKSIEKNWKPKQFI